MFFSEIELPVLSHYSVLGVVLQQSCQIMLSIHICATTVSVSGESDVCSIYNNNNITGAVVHPVPTRIHITHYMALYCKISQLNWQGRQVRGCGI